MNSFHLRIMKEEWIYQKEENICSERNAHFSPSSPAGMLCLITLIHKIERDEIIKKRSKEDWE